MTREFKPIPSPHPQEKQFAPARAAPYVGGIIISWTEIERAMGRSIKNERMRLKRAEDPIDRKLSHKFAVNFNEWCRLFVTVEQTRNALRDEARRLARIRNDVAHNIWTLRLDTELGVALNIVRENEDFEKEQREWLADYTTKGRRSQMVAPESFYTNTYFEADLEAAIAGNQRLWATTLQEEHDHYAALYPPPPGWQ